VYSVAVIKVQVHTSKNNYLYMKPKTGCIWAVFEKYHL